MRAALVACLAAAALVAGALLLTGEEDRTAPAPRIGVVANTRGYGDDAGGEQRRVRALGITWIREELEWREAEARPGRFDWRSQDAFMATAARAGMRVLPLLLSSPPWAAPEHLALPRDPEAFGRYVAAFAARFGPGGTFWAGRPEAERALAPTWVELWNEPYFEAFSKGGVDPARYARMVRAAVIRGRRANPRVRYLVAADLRTGGPDGVPWVPAMLEAVPDLARYVDGIAVHPYTRGAPVVEGGRPEDDARRTELVRDQLVAAGARDPQVWITEVGWPTCEGGDCVSRQEQAAHLRALLTDVARRPRRRRIDAVFVYHLRDFAGRPADDPFSHFGLIDARGRPKPALGVLREALP